MDKKHNFLFTDTEFLSALLTLAAWIESQVLLKVPRKDNIYNIDLKSVVPTRDLTCLIAKATIDESNTWHNRLGHIYFKTMKKLVKGNLVKGLPSKIFENGSFLQVLMVKLMRDILMDILGQNLRYCKEPKDNTLRGQAQKEKELEQEYILIPICTTDPSISQGPKDRERDTEIKLIEVDENEASDTSGKDDEPTRIQPVSTARPTLILFVPSPLVK
ncbi:putative ribonuclease H-like domain-containing protein [Tanacetum coccineum]